LKIEGGELRMKSAVVYDVFGKIQKVEKSETAISLSLPTHPLQKGHRGLTKKE